MTKADKTARARKAAKPPKLTKADTKIIAGLKEALEYMKTGELKGARVHVAVDVAGIRARTGLSQTKFASVYGLDVRTLQDWEQGRRTPERAAQLYLRVIEREPEAVKRALHAA